MSHLIGLLGLVFSNGLGFKERGVVVVVAFAEKYPVEDMVMIRSLAPRIKDNLCLLSLINIVAALETKFSI